VKRKCAEGWAASKTSGGKRRISASTRSMNSLHLQECQWFKIKSFVNGASGKVFQLRDPAFSRQRKKVSIHSLGKARSIGTLLLVILLVVKASPYGWTFIPGKRD